MTHLVFEPCPETLRTYFNYVLKHFCILEIPHMNVLWCLQKWLKLHVKRGRVGSARFVSMKISG
jgi:hypothetical protein